MNRSISSLQGLRAIGAIMIFIHHYCDVSDITEALGDCGVTWFMTLSGFVLSAAYSDRINRIDIRQFIIRRFKRIAPIYYFSLFMMLAIYYHATGLKALVASLLMIQSWFSESRIFISLNWPSWFISDLMFCSLLFIPLNRLFTKQRKWLWLVIAIGVIAYFTTVAVTPADMTLYWIYIFPPMQLASFVAGMLLVQVASRWRWAKPTPPQANILIISAFALVAV
ncbi:MAG: acyltransferase, partial [Muribaculaceae bacterium]|nr:acyltransferase [Muribaculaceae bacterium]